MLTKFRILLLILPIWLQAGLFNWFEPLSPKAQRAKDVLDGFDAQIERALSDYQVPGMVVGIVVDGRVVYSKGFGYRDLEKKLPMTDETLCAIGSCTKAFTTFVMGNLVDEGLLGWDQPVIDVLPQFRLWDQYATTNLTIRDLLTHRTGMPRHEFVWYNSKMNKAEMLKRIRYLQPSFDIRERYQYNNLMYFTAGLAMEEVTGKTWEELIQERILKPLDMTSTNFSVKDMQKSGKYAFPYVERSDKQKKMAFRDLSLIGPAGSLNSNVVDMTHWIQMQLARGVYHNQTLISPATLQELHAPQIIVPGAPETKETLLYAYGIGWVVLSYRGHYFISHDGVSDGFTSVIGLLPGENIGLIVIANKNMTSLPRYLSFAAIDRILELPFHDWFKEGVDSIRKNKESLKERIVQEDRSRRKGTCHSHPLEDYPGVYENPGYGALTIELVNGQLQANYNDLLFVLEHWHYDVFNVIEEKQDMIVSIEGKKFSFCNEPNGEIGRLVVPFEPTAEDIIFTRRPTEKLSTLNYLRQFIGVFEIYGYVVEIVVRDHTLVAIIPGQPNYELVPSVENEFTVKTMTGSTVRFVMHPDNRVKEVLLIHPYGTFSATPRR
jgi:CubicO group peptidase (beta-lactamase class C family)